MKLDIFLDILKYLFKIFLKDHRIPKWGGLEGP